MQVVLADARQRTVRRVSRHDIAGRRATERETRPWDRDTSIRPPTRHLDAAGDDYPAGVGGIGPVRHIFRHVGASYPKHCRIAIALVGPDPTRKHIVVAYLENLFGSASRVLSRATIRKVVHSQSIRTKVIQWIAVVGENESGEPLIVCARCTGVTREKKRATRVVHQESGRSREPDVATQLSELLIDQDPSTARRTPGGVVHGAIGSVNYRNSNWNHGDRRRDHRQTEQGTTNLSEHGDHVCYSLLNQGPILFGPMV